MPNSLAQDRARAEIWFRDDSVGILTEGSGAMPFRCKATVLSMGAELAPASALQICADVSTSRTATGLHDLEHTVLLSLAEHADSLLFRNMQYVLPLPAGAI